MIRQPQPCPMDLAFPLVWLVLETLQKLKFNYRELHAVWQPEH